MCHGRIAAFALVSALSACAGRDAEVGQGASHDGGTGNERSEEVDHCPDPEHPRVHYRERDSSLCVEVQLDCTEEQNGFNNACGCGCIDKEGDPLCPLTDDSHITWLSRDPDECSDIPPACPLGQLGFSNSCGCGCIER